jgi:hypothetical protein
VGPAAIDRTLRPTLTNPYPRYRDIGLVAIGAAVAAVPDDDWADRRLRSILLAGLDAEGVTFTFDLPTLVLAETRRRKRAAVTLAAYVDQAKAHVAAPDRWGTGTRALSAEAVSRAAQGDPEGAMTTLVEASRQPLGFAGYATVTYLALANRCIEFGRPEAASDAVWGANGGWTLVDLAREHARRVLDVAFRKERLQLVDQYAAWIKEPSPDLKAVQAIVAVTPDPDTRRAYKGLAAANWSAAGTQDSREWLKSLVPMVLEDTTTLDGILASVVGPRLAAMPDKDLSEAVQVVEEGLTGGRPWDLGIIAD